MKNLTGGQRQYALDISFQGNNILQLIENTTSNYTHPTHDFIAVSKFFYGELEIEVDVTILIKLKDLIMIGDKSLT